MAKKILSAVFVCTVLALCTGCSKETDTTSKPHKETVTLKSYPTETDKPNPTEPPTLYVVNPLFENEEITKIIIMKESGGGYIRVEITSSEKIKNIISMFNNWDMQANKVPEENIKDLGLDIEIVFNDNLVIRTSSSNSQPQINYYGSVGDVCYYLPRRFWEYVYNKII